MKIKAQDLTPGMIVRNPSGSGLLKVVDATEMAIELFPQQYQIKFEGVGNLQQVSEDDEFELSAVD
jgi:hypothetical protein